MLKQLLALARLTLHAPRAACDLLLADVPERGELLRMATLVVVLSTLFSGILVELFGPPPLEPMAGVLTSPILYAVMQFMVLMITTIAVFVIGRMFGGHGSFDEALLLMVWLQFYMLLVQVGLFAVTYLSNGATNPLNLGVYFYFIWLMVVFVAALHGFRSYWAVFAGLLASSMAISFVVVVLLAILGFMVEGA